MKNNNPLLVFLLIISLLFLLPGWRGAGAYSSNLQTRDSILYVKPDETGTCSSWSDACDLQSALYYAESGNQIWVAAGTYKPTTGPDQTISFLLKSGVAIYGGFPASGGEWADRDWQANPTILSGDIGVGGTVGDNSYHVLRGENVNATAVVDGFEVSHGFAPSSAPHPHHYGGGMYNNLSSPTMNNIIFTNNIGYFGGGMYNYQSNPTLNNVIFNNNQAIIGGGGISNSASQPTLINVTFINNTAYRGGGMLNVESSPTLNNVTFNNNHVSFNGGGMYNEGFLLIFPLPTPSLVNVSFVSNSAGVFGGGMYNIDVIPTLNNVAFSNNSAEEGGGIFSSYSNLTLTDVTFDSNSASVRGGGMNSTSGTINLTNVTFSGNSAPNGGGMLNTICSPSLTNVTFSGNIAGSMGGGIYNDFSNPVLTNAILWGNSPDQVYNDPDSATTVTYSIIQGGSTETGNIADDPLLGPLADNGGFTQTHALGQYSPAIDAADAANCPAYDQRGFERPIDGDQDGTAICDMGAFEYGATEQGYSQFMPLIMR